MPIPRLKDNYLKTFHHWAQTQLAELYPPQEYLAILYLLYEDVLQLNKIQVVLNQEKRLSESEMLCLLLASQKLSKGMPIQQVLGYGYFGDLKFQVNQHTLIPRPETYELVQHIINELSSMAPMRILDIGTGSGCITIALATAMPQHSYTGWDISKEALAIAQSNAEHYRANIHLEQRDILQNNHFDDFDIIVSNPPYIPEIEKSTIATNVKNFEPSKALFVPNDNTLLYYKSILKQAYNSKKSKLLYCETHEKQTQNLIELFDFYELKEWQFYKDIHSKDRYFKAITNP